MQTKNKIKIIKELIAKYSNNKVLPCFNNKEFLKELKEIFEDNNFL